MGIHGTKNLWKIRKMEEIDALNVTLQRLFNNETNDGASFW
jgi:hypothetical protein